MEVNRANFFWALPSMLHEAEKARFVAIDVEMSGIAWDSVRAQQENAIQVSYTRIKEAAEKFQILQIGFTFVVYDEKEGRCSYYSTRTFNCPISPLFYGGPFQDRLARHLDRNFAVSARSYAFLRKHGFDLNYAMDHGVQYVSRKDRTLLEQHFSSIEDEHKHVDPSTLDEESQQFYDIARGQIAAIATGPSKVGMRTLIKNPHGNKLNSLQIRLVHQIITEEFPNCIAQREPGGGAMTRCMSVTTVTETNKSQRTELHRRQNMDNTKKLSGGDFASRINRAWSTHSNRASAGTDTLNKFNENFNFRECEASLKQHRPILVGHNLFQDLAFIYNTFFEPLPPHVDDFLERINELFPRIVDTKYMQTRGGHLMEVDRSLHDLHTYYARRQFPAIRDEPLLGDSRVAGPHNAGFDSRMTANVFLKQTYSLFSTKRDSVKVNEECYERASQDRRDEEESALPDSPSAASQAETEMNNSSLLDLEEADVLGALKAWSVLTADESAQKQPALPATIVELPPSEPDQTKKPCQEVREAIPAETYSAKELHIIPGWTHEFWRTYGNKSSITGAGYVSFA
ncbi:CAF1-domain-containing protein [Hypoxylon sp. FL0543]|nr:CAF1-domain-containing protein [Hypoxylon sp. FL0543]